MIKRFPNPTWNNAIMKKSDGIQSRRDNEHDQSGDFLADVLKKRNAKASLASAKWN